MTISGISGVTTGAQRIQVKGQAEDSYSRSIQNQIANAQKELQELSSNENLSLEEKMKKRQKINQEITNLNNQLRQYQMELRRETQKKSKNSMEEMLGGNHQTQKKSAKTDTGISSAGMQAIVSADMSMNQVQIQGSVKTSLEGRIGVLEAEMKQDAGRGASTEQKEAELLDLQEKTAQVTSSQMRTLSQMNEELHEAEEKDNENTENADTEVKTSGKNQLKPSEDANGNVSSVKPDTAALGAAASITDIPADYIPVDIQL